MSTMLRFIVLLKVSLRMPGRFMLARFVFMPVCLASNPWVMGGAGVKILSADSPIPLVPRGIGAVDGWLAASAPASAVC
jgi:hypothetical protein